MGRDHIRKKCVPLLSLGLTSHRPRDIVEQSLIKHKAPLNQTKSEADLSEFKEGFLACEDGEILTQVPMRGYERCFRN